MADKSGQGRSVADTIRRVTNVVRVVAVIVLLGMVAMGVRSLITFYSDQVGLSAPRAAQAYVEALIVGNVDTVYAMTDKESLTDLYGRPAERADLAADLRALVGENPLPAQSVVTAKLFDHSGLHYYEVTVTYASGGQPLVKRLVLELRNEEGSWLVTWPLGTTS